MELENVSQIEYANRTSRSELFRLGTALIFVVGVMLYTGMSVGQISNGYLAINIGANDVANNVENVQVKITRKETAK